MVIIALGPFLYTGITLAIFNLSGTVPVRKEELKRYAKGSDMKTLSIFKIFTGKLKGPADLEELMLPISVSISLEVIE